MIIFYVTKWPSSATIAPMVIVNVEVVEMSSARTVKKRLFGAASVMNKVAMAAWKCGTASTKIVEKGDVCHVVTANMMKMNMMKIVSVIALPA